MPKYCDTKLLESIWGRWIYAVAIPELESLRKSKLLLVKIIDSEKALYCVATVVPYFFEVNNKKLLESDLKEAQAVAILPLASHVADQLQRDNYVYDAPARSHWDTLVSMIYTICNGLALKFNPASEEERLDLAHEALKQTLTKIERGKLKFEPGRAPVFNLLTTAIIRIMYSIKNKEKRRRVNQSKLTNDIACGKQMPHSRSLAISRSGSRGIKTN